MSRFGAPTICARPKRPSAHRLSSLSKPVITVASNWPFLLCATIEQPSLHRMQAEGVSASALPCQRANRSVSVPVGQMSMQAPQNTQPENTWLLSKAVPMRAHLPRLMMLIAGWPWIFSQIRQQRPQRMHRL